MGLNDINANIETEDTFENDYNKVFVPCRTVIEMEMLTSLVLGTINYDQICDIPQTRPDADQICELFGIQDNEAQMKIIHFFTEVAVEKLKPIVMYERDHHDVNRVGKVIPYTKTRMYLFFALHRLKFKFLILHIFVQMLNADMLPQYLRTIVQQKSVLAALTTYYYQMHTINLEKILPTSSVSKMSQISSARQVPLRMRRIFDMATYKFPDEENNGIKYIMRGIKGILFVCKLLFAKIDMPHPFPRVEEEQIDPEDLMINTDFISEMIPVISQNLFGTRAP